MKEVRRQTLLIGLFDLGEERRVGLRDSLSIELQGFRIPGDATPGSVRAALQRCSSNAVDNRVPGVGCLPHS